MSAVKKPVGVYGQRVCMFTHSVCTELCVCVLHMLMCVCVCVCVCVTVFGEVVHKHMLYELFFRVLCHKRENDRQENVSAIMYESLS